MCRVLARTYVMISEILEYEEQIAKLKGTSNAGIKSNARNNSEIERLTKELEKKDRDLQTLKNQAAGNNKAYNDLADEHAKVTARPGEVKKDL
jgi:B-cell receptor-associated protein 31